MFANKLTRFKDNFDSTGVKHSQISALINAVSLCTRATEDYSDSLEMKSPFINDLPAHTF